MTEMLSYNLIYFKNNLTHGRVHGTQVFNEMAQRLLKAILIGKLWKESYED